MGKGEGEGFLDCGGLGSVVDEDEGRGGWRVEGCVGDCEGVCSGGVVESLV